MAGVGGARGQVDRPAIVGIDQAQVPELGALVEIGHARHGQPQQASAPGHSRRRRARCAARRPRSRAAGRARRLGHQRHGEVARRRLVGLVDGGPVAASLASRSAFCCQPARRSAKARRPAAVARRRGRAARRRRSSAAAWRCRRARACHRRAQRPRWPRSSARSRSAHSAGHARSAPRAARAHPRRACDRGWRWPASRAAGRRGGAACGAWKAAASTPKRLDIEADIVARQQAAVAIEAGVLDRLGGDRRAQLLEARDGARAPGSAHRAAARSIAQRSVGRQVFVARRRPRCQHGASAARARRRAIGAIDRKMRQQLGQHAAQRGRLRSPVFATDRRRRRRLRAGPKSCAATISRRAGSSSAAKSAGRPLSAAQASASTRLAGRVVLQRAHLVHEVVAGGAVAAPVGRQVSPRSRIFSTTR